MLSASKKIDYGILFMTSLPECGDQEFRSLSEIAKSNQLSAKFLEQIVTPLKKSGLVLSKGGKHGGYQLAKPSDEMTLYEVYESIEGSVHLMHCLNDDLNCHREHNCNSKEVWSDLQEIVNTYLKNRKLSEFKNNK